MTREVLTPTIEPAAQALLTDQVRAVFTRLHLLMDDAARTCNIQVRALEVSAFTDYEEDSKELVITQWVDADAEAALDYWDRLGAEIQLFSSGLPKVEADILANRISVEVQWEHDVPTDTTV